MIPYIVVIACIPLFDVLLKPARSKSLRLLYVWIIFGMLAILAMIRSSTVGVDTQQFVSAYEDIGSNPSFSLDQYRYEYGFTLLCRLLYGISPNPQLLIMVSGAFIVFSVAYTVYHYSYDVALSAFIFLTMCTYFSYLNVMRQAIAVGFVLLGYSRLLRRKWVTAAILFLAAVEFHQSAWLVLFAMLIAILPYSKKTTVIYVCVIVVTFLGSSQVTSFLATLLGREQFYSEAHSGSNYYGALIKLIFFSCIVFMCFHYMSPRYFGSKSTLATQRILQFYQHILMLWIMFAALGVKVEVMSRLGQYFSALVLIIVPFALSRAPIQEWYWVVAIFCIVSFLYFLIIAISRPEWTGAIPYTTNLEGVWQVIKDIFSNHPINNMILYKLG